MRNLLTLLTIPPVVSVPIIVITYLISTEINSNVPLGIWTLVVSIFLALTILYIRVSLYDMLQWRTPIQFTAQGGLMSVLAIQFDLPYVSWIGVLLILTGLIISCSIIFPGGDSNAAKRSTRDDIFDSYPFPACVSDLNGTIISISQGFAQLIGKNRDRLMQMNMNSLVPSNGIIQVGGKFVQVIKLESNNRIWYTMREGGLGLQSMDLSARSSGTPINDLETNIFSKEYCRIRTEEEVVRIKRYKRWAVFMLIKINFTGTNEEYSTNRQSETAFFNSFCLFVKNTLRNCDTVSRVDEYSVFLILPETLSEEPVIEVTKKVLNFSSQLSPTISQLKCKISPGTSHIFYNASSQDMSFDSILLALNNTLSECNYT